jgi:hypothetical protein
MLSTHRTPSTLTLPPHLSAERLNRTGRLEFEAQADCAPDVPRILKPGTRDVCMSVAPIVVYRDGFAIEVYRSPFWHALIDSQSQLGWVDAYGASFEDAVSKAIERLKSLQDNPKEAA